MFPEAQSFALEALAKAEQYLVDPQPHPDSTQLLSLCESVLQQANGLLGLLEGGDVAEIERQYCALCCAVSELRHLLSVGNAAESPPVEQRLPNELVLRALQFVDCSFNVFPLLSRATERMSESSPEILGVYKLILDQSELPESRPRFISSVDIASACHYFIDSRLTLFGFSRSDSTLPAVSIG